YVIQSNDPEMARAFLTEAVRWSIGNLSRLAPLGGLLVSINPERMLVQIDRNLGLSAEGLTQAVHEALIVHDGLRQGVAARLSEGIAIVSVGPASADETGLPICKVCMEAI